MDKWVPGLCLIFSAVFGSTAYFLYSTQISDAFDITTKDIVETINEEKKRILIVPGHDKDNYGAKFNNLKEEEINLKLGNLIFDQLSDQESLDVFITRDDSGYTEIFKNYFSSEEKEISKFIESHKKETSEKIKDGEFEPVNVVEHNHVGKDISHKLYGINKWVNENDIDFVLHIHFNDYPRKNHKIKGKYEGFSIYIPSSNLDQESESRDFAEILKDNLETYFSPSNLAIEKEIIIENSDLIAVGSNKTLYSTPSVLVEYGYIYEDLFNEDNIDYVLSLISEKTVESITKFIY